MNKRQTEKTQPANQANKTLNQLEAAAKTKAIGPDWGFEPDSPATDSMTSNVKKRYQDLSKHIEKIADEIGEKTRQGPTVVFGSTTASGINIPHGHKFDSGKPRMELLPIQGIRMASAIMTGGANKYNENNWTGLKASRILGAGMRHLQRFLGGQDYDTDSGQHHLGHLLANLLMVQHIVNFFPEQDDRIHWGDEVANEDADDYHIYRSSRGITETSQYTLLPPDSLEAAARWLTMIAETNGDHWWQYDDYKLKSYLEFIFDQFLMFANRETDDLGRAIANTMIVVERLSRYNIEDDRIFNYVEN